MKNLKTAALIAFALVASGIGFHADAEDRVVAFAENQAGGKVMLTNIVDDEVCADREFRAASLIPGLGVLGGCWTFKGDDLYITWDDDRKPRQYEAGRFTVVEGN